MSQSLPSLLLGALLIFLQAEQPYHGEPVDLTTSMAVDVDGAPNAYGPKDKPTLDFELNAHEGARRSGKIVGYLTQDGHPVLQGSNDPFPGYYISTTGFADEKNQNLLDPRRYLDATKVNYVVRGRFAKQNHVALGDFAVVHSTRTQKTVYAIVGDSGNSSGGEGSLALLQALGYPFANGKSDSVRNKEITIRYFPGSNSQHTFYATQAEIDKKAAALGLGSAIGMH